MTAVGAEDGRQGFARNDMFKILLKGGLLFVVDYCLAFSKSNMQTIQN